MAGTVPDAARTLQVIAGKDPKDPRQSEVKIRNYLDAVGEGVDGLQIGVVREAFGFSEWFRTLFGPEYTPTEGAI